MFDDIFFNFRFIQHHSTSFNIIQHHLHIIYTFYKRIFRGKPFGKFAVGTSPDLEVSTVSTGPVDFFLESGEMVYGCGSKWKTDVGPQMWMSSLVLTIHNFGVPNFDPYPYDDDDDDDDDDDGWTCHLWLVESRHLNLHFAWQKPHVCRAFQHFGSMGCGKPRVTTCCWPVGAWSFEGRGSQLLSWNTWNRWECWEIKLAV